MYIKDEYLILEKLQKIIDSGDGLILHPYQIFNLIIGVISFLAGFWVLFTVNYSLIPCCILFSITFWHIGCYFSKVGLLIINQKGLISYDSFGMKEIPWTEIERAQYAYTIRSHYLVLVLKGEGQVKLSGYDYKNAPGPILIKLINRNAQCAKEELK